MILNLLLLYLHLLTLTQLYSNLVYNEHDTTYLCLVLVVLVSSKISGVGLPHYALLSQMVQWSILGNAIKYVQYKKHPQNFHKLNISAVHKEKSKGKSMSEGQRHSSDLDFVDTPEKLKGEYLDVNEGIQSKIFSITMFDENLDLSTTYLGRVDLTKQQIKAEESFPISEQGYTISKLLDSTACQVLLDTGASK